MNLVDSFSDTLIYLYEFIEYLEEVNLGIVSVNHSIAIADKSVSTGAGVPAQDEQDSDAKNEVAISNNGGNGGNGGNQEDINSQIDIGVIRANFKEVLSADWIKADEAGYLPKVIERAAYAIIALIDEKIIASKWGQINRWFKVTLQSEYFSGSNAGMKVFEYIKDRSDAGTSEKDLVEVYYYCLSCGFMGSYYSQPAKLREIRAELYQYIKQQQKSQDDQLLIGTDDEAVTEVMESHFIIKTKHICGSLSFHMPIIASVLLSGYFYLLIDSVVASLVQ
jgi:type IV/VI secretion system ImpK/VasF family protein